MLSYLNDLARLLIKNNRISEVSGSLSNFCYTTLCIYKFNIFLFSFTLLMCIHRVIIYIMRSRFLTILAIVSPLLNIHYNNVDTPTKCTIVDKRTSEAGPFAVISLESHKKANTCIFSRKIFLRTITRLHARSFASCVRACIACIRTHVNAWRTKVTIEWQYCRGSNVHAWSCERHICEELVPTTRRERKTDHGLTFNV